MQPILTRCGYRCDLCLAYRPNVEKNPSDQQMLSNGWFKYFGFHILPENIICDGCMSVNPKLIDQSCPVRPCVIDRGLENCAQCEEYLCGRLAQRLVVYEEVQERVGQAISDSDFRCFILPYENGKRLAGIRAIHKRTRE